MHNIKARCLFCNNELSGRFDKKFCDVQCRSAYHNSVANKEEEQIKSINKILRKNRSILKFASPQGKTTINKSFLVDREFNFNYLTSTYESKAGNTYKFVSPLPTPFKKFVYNILVLLACKYHRCIRRKCTI